MSAATKTGAGVLVVAATAGELAWLPASGAEAMGLACGVGPVEAAATVARALAVAPPRAVLHVGIAGARRAANLPIGQLVVGAISRYDDLRAQLGGLQRELVADPALVAALLAALPGAVALPIGTSAAVGGTAEAPVEAMEGFGVLRACALAGVPAVELRAVSNAIEEDDRALWDFGAALAALARHGGAAVAAVAAALTGGR